MRALFATLFTLAAAAASAQLQDIEVRLELIAEDQMTNALVLDEPYDTYYVTATNPNPGSVTSIEATLTGSFLTTRNVTFGDPRYVEVIFGFAAPDTYFAIPLEVDPADVLAVNTVDDAGTLSSSFTVAGGTVLIPGNSEALFAVIEVIADTPVVLPSIVGRAAINGEFATIRSVPEPTGLGLVALPALVALTRRAGFSTRSAA